MGQIYKANVAMPEIKDYYKVMEALNQRLSDTD